MSLLPQTQPLICSIEIADLYNNNNFLEAPMTDSVVMDIVQVISETHWELKMEQTAV